MTLFSYKHGNRSHRSPSTFLYTLPHNGNAVLHKWSHFLNGTRLTHIALTLTLTFRTKAMVYTSCTVLTMSFSWNLNNTNNISRSAASFKIFPTVSWTCNDEIHGAEHSADGDNNNTTYNSHCYLQENPRYHLTKSALLPITEGRAVALSLHTTYSSPL